MPKNPNRFADMFRKLSPDEGDGRRSRAVPTGWVVGLVGLLTLALPLAVLGSVLNDDGPPVPDLAAVRLAAAESDDDGARDDDNDDRADGDRASAAAAASVRETVDGNTQRDGAYSVTGNTKIGDTTERPTQDGNTQRDGDNSISGNTVGADSTRAAAPAAAPAAQGFAPAYGPAGGGSVSAGSASG